MTMPPVSTYREIMLTKTKLAVQSAASPYILREASADAMIDDLTQQMVLRLDSHVWGQEDTKTLEIVEKPVYASWKHHLVATLPEGWRRRFLTALWSLEDEPLQTRVTHSITATGRAVFPEAEVRMPPEYGQVVRIMELTDSPTGLDYRW